ncbi:PSD1 and planctomycete cytochrome C domain-containing protein [Blastopirellula sp. JC732]|uniref:PSD1 and planctomycete cytochrome C domain-containing protein n=1 Tax=Blastopirellula sediminis TaxID=2894196 RepID=A0A9X1SEC3_9BACT|nr:PSD1 and planctomycete cytochrome C domain-containing protein [Blastopirellula sediminis]MCC9609539.1 PSD1 and planctomycete cytochrome C domain-containing protein [Blastopirellula sediminis]MCC9627685.1 PSD1 and planctomycete cytochrome C domain-containing protein [Blastopirellula sediminis]
MQLTRLLPAAILFLAVFFLAPLTQLTAAEIDFNRDIRPLFASKCFACHGPDESHREADLRLDEREAAVEYGAIVPGEPGDSLLLERIMSEDHDLQMPPPHTGDTLTAAQKKLFEEWIKAGAKYDKHWAFVRPEKAALPEVSDATWTHGPIDQFILARLDQEGLKPSAEADRYALIRRASLDLTGLPPTREETEAFVNDPDPNAYEKLVDRLLASPRYGERWARDWLDLVRYSDTNGYEKDRERSIWPYRDWVIRAINDDMPFDQFTIEQLAGDMLPHATESQRVATGLHRNTMLNEEGGIDPLEFRFYAMVDRAATTGTIWLGMTVGCAQCHTHKYDPITHTDFYSFLALLNNADEPDLLLKTPALNKEREKLLSQIEQAESQLPSQFPPEEGEGDVEQRRAANFHKQKEAWLTQSQADAVDWRTLPATNLQSNLPKLETLADGAIFASGDFTKRDVYTLTYTIDESQLPLTALRLEVLPDERLPAGGPGRCYYEGRKGDFFLSELSAKFADQPLKLADASHSYGKNGLGSGSADAANVLDENGSTGWSTADREGEANQLVVNLPEPIEVAGELTLELLFERHYTASLGKFRISAASTPNKAAAKQMPAEIETLLARKSDELTAEEAKQVERYYWSVAPELAEARKPIDELRKRLPKFSSSMVMLERPADNPRETFRHHRGEYLSPKEKMTPRIPEFLGKDSENAPADRLELAKWLVSKENPLAARVAANRAWQALFGRGLVETSGDFGTQSDPPSHPELLDYLACSLMENGWSIKKLHREIVLSSTYRQDSQVTEKGKEVDPQNRLLARGPRFRMEAEMVRDAMLRASGKLSDKMYGHGVFPPQPASVTALAYGGFAWNASQGEDRYRRSIYTFSKRTSPFAAYAAFDAPSGEECTAKRDRSNTPLQALTLLNDAMFIELAQAMAKEAKQGAESEQAIAENLFERLMTRPPTAAELKAILQYRTAQLERLQNGQLSAATIGGDPSASPEDAAWVMVARSLMNLDEAITKY